jgi:hypothetical protein
MTNKLKDLFSTAFDEENQTEDYKNVIAKDLNNLIGRAQYEEETSNNKVDNEFVLSIMRTVDRVSHFEEIKQM